MSSGPYLPVNIPYINILRKIVKKHKSEGYAFCVYEFYMVNKSNFRLLYSFTFVQLCYDTQNYPFCRFSISG